MREIKIEEQIWTIDNLDITTYRNGDLIPKIEDADEWKNLKSGAWCYFENNPVYNKEEDTYTCPQEQTLRTTGTWHKKTRERDSYNFKKYRTPACKECPVKHLSTGRAQGGRELDRSEFADAVEENNKRYHENTSLYRKRQELERSGTHEDK
jgi:hypothetical protein